MEKFELLDRFELQYPHLEKLSELRRLYIDKDLSSLFKITNADEELRKAVMEQNLHSVFRLVDDKYEDLRKAVVEKNWRSIFRLIPDTESVTNGIYTTSSVTSISDITSAGSGSIITDNERTKLNGIEPSADVTDTANVTAAGALMDSEVTDLSGIKSVTIST